MKVELTFTEVLLGTLSGNKEIAEEFIISKHPEGKSQEESESLPDIDETVEKSSTFFARTPDNMPMLWNYQPKGFFKEACAAMIHALSLGLDKDDEEMKKLKNDLKKCRLTEYLYKKTIDELVFVSPRRIPLILPEGIDPQKLKFWERPLRGQTIRGERISLARSEVAPEGTKVIFKVSLLNMKLDEYIRRWLNYGALKGLGQWRNSSCGSFSWKELTS